MNAKAWGLVRTRWNRRRSSGRINQRTGPSAQARAEAGTAGSFTGRGPLDRQPTAE
jgi:hypothetical protein